MTLDIMMPFYGRVDQLMTAVESIIGQSNGDWRLTIIDDQYPDLIAVEWARSLADPRIRYRRNSVNLGVSGNFRRSVELMTHEFAVIMGCDDVMLPGFVARLQELSAEFPDVSVFQPGVQVIDDDGRLCFPLADRIKALYRPRGAGTQVFSGPLLASSLARGNWAYFPSLVWRTEVVKRINFRPDLEVALDLALLFDLIIDGGKLALDDQVIFEYRRHTSSVSAFTAVDGSRFVEERDVLWKAADAFKTLNWNKAARTARRQLSSRLNALSVYPQALRSGSASDRRVLMNHILGRNHASRQATATGDW
jgi:glycosyltransferase involved in cell wall biosynthesis